MSGTDCAVVVVDVDVVVVLLMFPIPPSNVLEIWKQDYQMLLPWENKAEEA